MDVGGGKGVSSNGTCMYVSPRDCSSTRCCERIKAHVPVDG